MKFVKEHFNCCPIKGNILYKKAEKAKVSDILLQLQVCRECRFTCTVVLENKNNDSEK